MCTLLDIGYRPFMTRSMSEKPLAGKVAIVTGSGKGIGRAIVKGYAEAGARVCVTARTQSQVDEVAEEIVEAGGEAISVACDVTDPDAVTRMVDHTVEAFGGLDLVFMNAGGCLESNSIQEADPRIWRETIEVNLNSAFYTAQAVIPHLKARGEGKIITMGSGTGHKGHNRIAAYCAAKAGLWHFTRMLAEELISYNITVNELIPGIVHTKLAEGEKPERRLLDSLGGAHEYQKLPEDVVPLALHLATAPKYGPTAQSFSLTRRWI